MGVRPGIRVGEAGNRLSCSSEIIGCKRNPFRCRIKLKESLEDKQDSRAPGEPKLVVGGGKKMIESASRMVESDFDIMETRDCFAAARKVV